MDTAIVNFTVIDTYARLRYLNEQKAWESILKSRNFNADRLSLAQLFIQAQDGDDKLVKAHLEKGGKWIFISGHSHYCYRCSRLKIYPQPNQNQGELGGGAAFSYVRNPDRLRQFPHDGVTKVLVPPYVDYKLNMSRKTYDALIQTAEDMHFEIVREFGNF